MSNEKPTEAEKYLEKKTGITQTENFQIETIPTNFALHACKIAECEGKIDYVKSRIATLNAYMKDPFSGTDLDKTNNRILGYESDLTELQTQLKELVK